MQPLIWSTADARGASALHHWREVIDRSLFPLDISSSADGFHARLEQGAMGRRCSASSSRGRNPSGAHGAISPAPAIGRSWT